MLLNIFKKPVFIVSLFFFINAAHSEEKIIRVMTVVICQQDNFLQYVLEPYLKENNIKIEYRQGHHSEVAQAVKNREADFVITHTKVKQLQKMEQKGLLNKGRQLFANPMAFLGPENDPAHIQGLHDPVLAVRQILESNNCFVINGHPRLANIQNKLVEQTGITDGCVIQSDKQNEAILGDVIEKNAYTLWGLHPYAKRGEGKLKPVVIPDKVLLSNMTGWVVKGTAGEEEAKRLLAYLQSDQAKTRITGFRLNDYSDIQAWWLPVGK